MNFIARRMSHAKVRTIFQPERPFASTRTIFWKCGISSREIPMISLITVAGMGKP